MIILTDLSEVLIHGLQGTEEIVNEKYGERTADKFYRRMMDIEVDNCFRNLLRGYIKEETFWIEFLSEDYWPFDYKGAEKLFGENLQRPRINGVLEVYSSIASYPERIGQTEKKTGRPEIWIISDHIRERIPGLHEYHNDIFTITSKEIWSCEIGKVKGDEGFFEGILKDNDLQPEDVLFIDDWDRNTKAAGKLGIQCIEFKSAEQLKNGLIALGFEFMV